MKTALYVLFMLLTIPAYAQQIRNAGLERWQIGTSQRPDSFFTFDDVNMTAGVTRTTSAHSGQYAALLRTLSTPSGPIGGGMSYGRIDTTTFGLKGWPVSGRPVWVKFWYKYSRAGNDSAVAAVQVSKWKNNTTTAVGIGYAFITANTPTYTQATVYINYSDPAQPDSIYISFASSLGVATVGSALYVDDISLDGATGIEEQSANGTVSLSPNPVSGMLTLELPEEGVSDVAITDVAGRSLYHQQQATQKLRIDCRNWQGGMYFVTVRNGATASVGKFIRAD